MPKPGALSRPRLSLQVFSACLQVIFVFLPVLQAEQGAHSGHHRTGSAQKGYAQRMQPLPDRLASPQLSRSTSLLAEALNELPEAQTEYLMRLLGVNGYCDQRRVPFIWQWLWRGFTIAGPTAGSFRQADSIF